MDWKNEILERVRSLYMPSPTEGVEQRPLRPFHERFKNIQVTPNVTQTSMRGEAIYTSPAMDCKGFTLQNCFVSLKVKRDNVMPKPAGWTKLFTGVLEGTCGSSWSEIDAFELNSNGMVRVFPCPLLGDNTLSMAIRFVLYGANNYYNFQDARYLDLDLDGVLVAGPGF